MGRDPGELYGRRPVHNCEALGNNIFFVLMALSLLYFLLLHLALKFMERDAPSDFEKFGSPRLRTEKAIRNSVSAIQVLLHYRVPKRMKLNTWLALCLGLARTLLVVILVAMSFGLWFYLKSCVA